MARNGIHVDTATFRRQTRELARLTGRSVADVMKKEVGVIGGTLMKAFPPTKDITGNSSPNHDKKGGELGLRKQLAGIFFPMTDIDVLENWQDDLSSEFDVFDDTGSRIQDWHESKRDGKTGRVKPIRSGRFMKGRDFSGKLHVPDEAFEKYYKRRVKRMGNLKSGWIRVARLNPKQKTPVWVLRGDKKGSLSLSSFNRQTGDGYISFSNNTPYASKWKFINDRVMSVSKKRMIRVLRYEYKKALEKASFRQIAGFK